MPSGRQKYCFYAVTNGREVGVYTSWPQTGDSVVGFAQAKYKGYCTYSEAASAMLAAGFSEYTVLVVATLTAKLSLNKPRGTNQMQIVLQKKKK